MNKTTIEEFREKYQNKFIKSLNGEDLKNLIKYISIVDKYYFYTSGLIATDKYFVLTDSCRMYLIESENKKNSKLFVLYPFECLKYLKEAHNIVITQDNILHINIISNKKIEIGVYSFEKVRDLNINITKVVEDDVDYKYFNFKFLEYDTPIWNIIKRSMKYFLKGKTEFSKEGLLITMRLNEKSYIEELITAQTWDYNYKNFKCALNLDFLTLFLKNNTNNLIKCGFRNNTSALKFYNDNQIYCVMPVIYKED